MDESSVSFTGNIIFIQISAQRPLLTAPPIFWKLLEGASHRISFSGLLNLPRKCFLTFTCGTVQYLFMNLFTHLSIYLSIYLFIHWFIYSTFHLFTDLFTSSISQLTLMGSLCDVIGGRPLRDAGVEGGFIERPAVLTTSGLHEGRKVRLRNVQTW